MASMALAKFEHCWRSALLGFFFVEAYLPVNLFLRHIRPVDRFFNDIEIQSHNASEATKEQAIFPGMYIKLADVVSVGKNYEGVGASSFAGVVVRFQVEAFAALAHEAAWSVVAPLAAWWGDGLALINVDAGAVVLQLVAISAAAVVAVPNVMAIVITFSIVGLTFIDICK